MRDREFVSKLALGHKVEEAICEYYREHVDKRTRLPLSPVRGYDIICPDVGNIEVKEDRMSHETGYYAFEFQDHYKKPSGYMGTQAKEFVVVDWNNVIMTTTENLKYVIDTCQNKRITKMGYRDTNGAQCEGWLVPVNYVLYSPFVKVEERWFPHWRMINGRIC